MNWFQIIGMVAQVAGPVLGSKLAEKDKEEVLRILQEARDEFGRISIPRLQQLTLESLPPSEVAQIQEDPDFKRQMMAADSALEETTASGGLTLSDRAALNQILNRVSQQESAGRNAIEQKMQAQGALNSGARLTMQLANQQNAANQASQMGEAMAGQAQKRAYQAILDRANLAGTNSNRDWERERQKAAARDAINRSNVEIQNLTRTYNANIPQQNFNNQVALARGQAGASSPLASHLSQQADTTQSQWSQTGNAVGNIAGGIGKSTQSPPSENYDEWYEKLKEAKARGDLWCLKRKTTTTSFARSRSISTARAKRPAARNNSACLARRSARVDSTDRGR